MAEFDIVEAAGKGFKVILMLSLDGKHEPLPVVVRYNFTKPAALSAAENV
jgi:hypothetical protein